MSSGTRSTRTVALLVAATLALAACSGPDASPAITASAPSSLATHPTTAPHPTTHSTTAPHPTPHSTTAPRPTPTPHPTPTPRPTPHPTTEQPASSVVPAGFSGMISQIDEATATRMGGSWRPGCPVALSDLRYLTVTYRGFDNADHTGELVVAASVAQDVLAIFRELYDDRYPIASLRLVDDFGADDDASMAANNSSAFNCRPVTGGGGFSEHSYGTAIDLNPVQNPYLSGSVVLPPAGKPYVDRHGAPGVIQPGGAVVTAFAEHGWSWGGDWTGPIDYQHFSVTGR